MAKRARRNRITSQREFEVVMGRLIERGELDELNRIAVKTDYSDDFKEAAAVLDWLFNSGLDYPRMQAKIAALIRTYVLMGRGELADGKTYRDYVEEQDKKGNILN